MVLGVGLEPTSLAALAPKASAFAISPPQHFNSANSLPAGRQAPRGLDPAPLFMEIVVNPGKLYKMILVPQTVDYLIKKWCGVDTFSIICYSM